VSTGALIQVDELIVINKRCWNEIETHFPS